MFIFVFSKRLVFFVVIVFKDAFLSEILGLLFEIREQSISNIKSMDGEKKTKKMNGVLNKKIKVHT